MTEKEQYMYEINQRAVDDIVGKTVKFADLPVCGDCISLVFTDGTFYMAKLESDYYDSHEIANVDCEFSDIFCGYGGNERLTPLGVALGVDFEKCKEIYLNENSAQLERQKERRRIEYEKLKAEFENE